MDPADVVSGVQKMALGVIIAIVVGVILLVAVLITCCVCMCKVCAGRKKETHTVVYQAPPPHGYAADPNHPQFHPWPPGAQPSAPQANLAKAKKSTVEKWRLPRPRLRQAS
ncbi:hypothetical protein HPB47_013426 [Ixodes persulcatus]|uniref:Uncharacterized protein n=1 Tax=Ixodes persulcatus TaxID=34615 RepID=A0AC60R1W7_IXOPE|nr:hypothetical protein HPB47_013426 [Ixodes persulcatus]